MSRYLWTTLNIFFLLYGVGIRLEYLITESLSVDETIYIYQADSLLVHGVSSGLRDLVGTYESSPSLKVGPPPTRLAVTIPAYALRTILNVDGHTAGVLVSFLASVGTLVLVYLFFTHTYGPPHATLPLALLASSGLSLAIARRVWGDALLELCGGVLVIATTALAHSRSRRPLWLLLAACSASAAVLVKESGFVVVLLCSFGGFIARGVRNRNWLDALIVMSFPILSVAVTLALLALLLGDPIRLMNLYFLFGEKVGSNGYDRNWQNGPWYIFFLMLVRVAPILAFAIVGGVSLCGLAMVRRKITVSNPIWTPTIVAAIVWIGFLLAACYWANCKNLRYLAVITVPALMLIAASTKSWSAHGWWPRVARGWAFQVPLWLCVLFGAEVDRHRFVAMVVTPELLDLSRGVLVPR